MNTFLRRWQFAVLLMLLLLPAIFELCSAQLDVGGHIESLGIQNEHHKEGGSLLMEFKASRKLAAFTQDYGSSANDRNKPRKKTTKRA